MAKDEKVEEKAVEKPRVKRTKLGAAFAAALRNGSPAHKGYEDLSAEERQLRIDEDLERQIAARS